jgi:hypothetical protein
VHALHPKHLRPHGVANGTLWYALEKSLEKQKAPGVKNGEQALKPWYLFFHGKSWGFVGRASQIARHGSSISLLATRPSGSTLSGRSAIV